MSVIIVRALYGHYMHYGPLYRNVSHVYRWISLSWQLSPFDLPLVLVCQLRDIVTLNWTRTSGAWIQEEVPQVPWNSLFNPCNLEIAYRVNSIPKKADLIELLDCSLMDNRPHSSGEHLITAITDKTTRMWLYRKEDSMWYNALFLLAALFCTSFYSCRMATLLGYRVSCRAV